MMLRYYRVSTESVVRERHERLIVARTPEEALTQYKRGTAWPSSYDTQHLETIEQKPIQIDEDTNEDRGDPNDPANWTARAYFTDELQAEIPCPPPTKEEEDFVAAGSDDVYAEPEPTP